MAMLKYIVYTTKEKSFRRSIEAMKVHKKAMQSLYEDKQYGQIHHSNQNASVQRT